MRVILRDKNEDDDVSAEMKRIANVLETYVKLTEAHVRQEGAGSSELEKSRNELGVADGIGRE